LTCHFNATTGLFGTKYWCCPHCGYLFWRNLTATSGILHWCPVKEENLIIEEPKYENAKTTNNKNNGPK
jgi:phage terminase large subunit GpA-like protein